MPEVKAGQIEERAPLVDFDYWANLAKSDPEAFETRRREVIEDTISALPAHRQQRIRCLQWKIDQVRDRAGTPMAACIRISEMMWDSLTGPGGLRDALAQLSPDSDQPLPSARVLQMQPLRRQ